MKPLLKPCPNPRAVPWRRCRGSSLVEIVVAMGIASIMLGVSLAMVHLLMRVEQDATRHMWYRTTLARLESQFREDVALAAAAAYEADERRLSLQMPEAAAVSWQLHEDRIERHRELDADRAQHEVFRLPRGSTSRVELTEDSTRVTLRIVHRWTGGIHDPKVLGEETGREIAFAARLGSQHRFLTRTPQEISQ